MNRETVYKTADEWGDTAIAVGETEAEEFCKSLRDVGIDADISEMETGYLVHGLARFEHFHTARYSQTGSCSGSGYDADYYDLDGNFIGTTRMYWRMKPYSCN